MWRTRREGGRKEGGFDVIEGRDGGPRKVARLLARVFKVHALRGSYTSGERHSGQTDIDIETRLPTICNIYLNV